MIDIYPKVESVVDSVYVTLADDIFSMRFPPGAKITETALCERYGVSRNTLREAVALLLSHGLLVKIANKGIYVRELNYTDVKEIFRLRELLELEAIRSIMDSGNIPLELVQLVNQIDSNVTEDSWEANLNADVKFHSYLVIGANSPRLQRLYSAIFAEVKLCIYQSRHIVPINPNNSAHHRKILTAMENDELEGAQRLLSEHIHAAVESYRAVFEP